MNPLLVQWKMLPLWLKLALLPFVISGALTAFYILTATIASLFALAASLVSHSSRLWNKAGRSVA